VRYLQTDIYKYVYIHISCIYVRVQTVAREIPFNIKEYLCVLFAD